MRLRHALPGAMVLTLLAAGCGSGGRDNPAEPTGFESLAVTPSPLVFTAPGQQTNLMITGAEHSGAPLQPSDIHVALDGSTVAALGQLANAQGGLTLPVNAVGVGRDRIVVSAAAVGSQTAMSPGVSSVIVYPGGTWSGDVGLTATTCSPPGQGAYKETLVVEVNASGSGSATAQDTPNFNRRYSVSFGADWFDGTAVTATGSFTWLGSPVSGAAGLRLTGPRTIDYTETTTYPCSATYHGVLTRQ